MSGGHSANAIGSPRPRLMDPPTREDDRSERCGVFVRGIVQGVGFRPFVYSLATRLELAGFVRNHADGVLIELEGAPAALASFLEKLRSECPRPANIEQVEVRRLPPRGQTAFGIDPSEAFTGASERFFAPDLSTCASCLAELFDTADRRHRYPFVNCAHCGPRLTIVREAPYDRARTTMASFVMCDACQREYDDPDDRRFHAQANACAACGPRLRALDAAGEVVAAEPLAFATELLAAGRIVALKGLGGYHLACDARSNSAVAALRARKHREERPFAVMVGDVSAARRLCEVSELEAELLCSAARPIVLLRRHPRAAVADAVAPHSPMLGVMLPYTPLHHLLVADHGGGPLVLTSGNRSDEPMVCDDDEAAARLAGVADGFLTHDRAIQVRCDDSVARIIGDKPVIYRRSRGLVPAPLRLPFACSRAILALGGHLKNTFALGRGERAFLSHHLGDLGEWGSYKAYRAAVEHYEALFAIEPEVIVHDLHPAYATTEYAQWRRARDLPKARVLAVQHHHAHMASCMAEHGLAGPVLGVTFDGAGYGSDGSLWGGELLVGDYTAFRRAAHLRAVPLPGGERAIREPWRMALAHLVDCQVEPERFLTGISGDSVRVVQRMIAQRLQSPLTSSAGRLFDAVAALLGVRSLTSFEGQAALELEALASTSDVSDAYPFAIDTETAADGLVVDTRPLVSALLDALQRGDAVASIARRFHNTIAAIVVRVAELLREQTGIERVVLSGGVFQNAILVETTTRGLAALGFRVYSHSRVPANDGGLSFGQLVIAAAMLEGGA